MARKTNLALIILIIAILISLIVLPQLSFASQSDEEDEGGITVDDLQIDEDYYGKIKGKNRKVIVYNWGEYISDGSDDMLSVNKAFTQLTGIEVIYLTFSTNEELYAKLNSGNTGYDVIIPSDYMIGKMIEHEMIQPLNYDLLPNSENLDPNFTDPDYDPQGVYSVPYTWGITGIIYNKQLLKDEDIVDSWDILWDEKYEGEILMFSNSRDAFGIAEKKLGYSLNTEDPKELAECLNLLKEQKPLVQAYVMDEIFDKMIGGEATLAPYYAGDAVTMMEDNPNLDFVAPKEGVNIFVDAAAIPVDAPDVEAAHMYINFLMEPQIAAVNAEYIGYATPNIAAHDYMDEEILSNPISYPDDEVIENAEYFLPQSREIGLLVDDYWTELLSSDQKYNMLLVPILMVVAIALTIAINIYRASIKKRKHQYYS